MKQKLKSPDLIRRFDNRRFDNHLMQIVSIGNNQYNYLNHVWLKMRNIYDL